MARAAVPGRLTWRVATVTAVRDETVTARTLVLDVPDWPGHLPGQHVDVRLTAPDGYSTQRSYSIASPTGVELTVQRIPDGEVSPYLTEVLAPGDPLELRGPVGGWFVWRPDRPAPVLLAGGGSGIVPLMAMIRARAQANGRQPFRLIHSVRDPTAALYHDELRRYLGSGVDVHTVWTRKAPDGGPVGRVSVATVNTYGWPPAFEPDCFVCGPTGFVEVVADILVALGHDPRRIRTERFGGA